MQTFLPHYSFTDSAAALDYRRLGKQRVECMQLLKAIKNGAGWSNHPAAKMWKGYEEALETYMAVCIDEWVKRGYKNTMVAVTDFHWTIFLISALLGVGIIFCAVYSH